MAYVDKAKLMSRIESELIRWGESEYNALQILGDIEDFPTADVSEVVRCEKCQHRKWEQEPCHGKIINHCERTGLLVDKYSFCSYGERRTDNDL